MQINERIELIKIPFSVPIGSGIALERFANCFLLKDAAGIILVDSGVAGAEAEILARLAAGGRHPEEIKLLLLSHSHPDHLGSAAAIHRLTGCQVAAHPAERAWIEDIDRQARERPVPGFSQLVGGAVTVDRLLADGDQLALGDLKITVLHTPGHSPGSLSLHLPEQGVLICGDAVPLPGDLPIFTDWAAAMASLQRLREITGVEWLLSSWDRPRQGREVAATLAAGMAWLERIKVCVREEGAKLASDEPMALCRAVVARLGLPPAAVNPLVAKSFASCG